MNAAQFFRGFTSTAAVLVFMLVGSAVASGHIQVRPAVVAPGDAAEFTVLVPGERDPAWTTRVELKLPAGLLPFSYGETPGWKRSLIKASNGRVDRIVWTGRLAPDGFVAFSFLAGTPDQPGLLTWKALQTYNDGEVSRWIGVPSDDFPAATTEVVAGAEVQNSGGESGNGGSAGTVRAEPTGPDWLLRGLAAVAFVIATLALVLALVLRRRLVRAEAGSGASSATNSDSW
jgi:uncharacterized protein YcnI